ncbi:MAG: hypothetical protein ACLP3B_12010 [Syntrophobacteraceae bacterium]
MITHIGDYYLEQPVGDIYGLKEYTDDEYIIFEMAGAPRVFKDEKIYHVKDVSFLGFNWDTIIGTTEGKIYKIAILFESYDKTHQNTVYKLALEYLSRTMGKHTHHSFLSHQYMWKSQQGNVICNKVSKGGYHCVNVFLTASFMSRNNLR